MIFSKLKQPVPRVLSLKFRRDYDGFHHKGTEFTKESTVRFTRLSRAPCFVIERQGSEHVIANKPARVNEIQVDTRPAPALF